MKLCDEHSVYEYDLSLWEKIIVEDHERREKARKVFLEETVQKLIDFFKDRNVQRVYLFGSLLKEGCFYEFSDIDIAVEDLKEDYFMLYTELEELLGRTLDLVELEKCRFKEHVVRTGVRIK